MKIITLAFAVLLASVYAYSENTDSADADFCFRFSDERPGLLLVKKNNNLEIRTTGETLECGERYSLGVFTNIDFIDGIGQNILSFKGVYGISYGGSYPERFDRILPPIITLDFPDSMRGIMKNSTTKIVLDDLLQFKDRILDGYMNVSVSCGLNYTLNFRARITGECSPQFLNEREQNQ